MTCLDSPVYESTSSVYFTSHFLNNGDFKWHYIGSGDARLGPPVSKGGKTAQSFPQTRASLCSFTLLGKVTVKYGLFS